MYAQARLMWSNVESPYNYKFISATNDLVDEAKCIRDEKKRGFNWTLPHSMTPPREDMYDGGKCKIYDVIFHPNTYRYVINSTT